MENEKEKALLNAMSDLDGVHTELEDLFHLLAIYDENLNSDIEPICEGKSWADAYLRGRWPLHKSMLNVINLRLYDILGELQECVEKGYGALWSQDRS